MSLFRFISLGLYCLGLVSANDKKTVLAQLGPYPVTVTNHELRTNRTDPLASTPEKRRFMVTVYRPHLDTFACPVEAQEYFPYASPILAQGLNDPLSGSFGILTKDYESIQLVNCSALPHSANATQHAPVVLFSPGLESSRYVHAALLQAVSSSGYTVVSVDHTYDAAVVVFPDGQVARANISDTLDTDSQSVVDEYLGNFIQGIRQADFVNVLDALESQVLPGYDPSNGPLKAAVFGHSVGGSTALGAIQTQHRLVAGMNMDGTFLGHERNVTTRKPFYMMQEAYSDDPTWPLVYSDSLKGWKSWTIFNNTHHLALTDLPLLTDVLNKRDQIEVDALGAVTGSRNLELDWRYTVDFLDYALKGRQPKLLEKSSFQFPDVTLVHHAQ